MLVCQVSSGLSPVWTPPLQDLQRLIFMQFDKAWLKDSQIKMIWRIQQMVGIVGIIQKMMINNARLRKQKVKNMLGFVDVIWGAIWQV